MPIRPENRGRYSDRLKGPQAVHAEQLDAEWRQRAACVGTPADWWFPGPGGSTREARAVCQTCPVVAACLESALTIPGHVDTGGIRAGVGPATRQKLRRERRRQVA